VADTNIFAGYALGRQLSVAITEIPAALRDASKVASFVDRIDCALFVDGAATSIYFKPAGSFTTWRFRRRP
jgi:hypothetical protein